ITLAERLPEVTTGFIWQCWFHWAGWSQNSFAAPDVTRASCAWITGGPYNYFFRVFFPSPCATIVSNSSLVTGITDRRDCRTSSMLPSFGSVLIVVRGTGAPRGFNGLMSTATHWASSAVGSGYAAFATCAIP